MNVKLTRDLWLLPALIVLTLISWAVVYTWGVPYVGAVWDSTGRVLGVEAGGPAERIGLRAGDVILSIDGRLPTRWADRVRRAFQSGDPISVTVQRGERSYALSLTADLFPVSYRFTLPLFQLVALAFCILSLVVLLGATDTTEARLFYLMAQIWAADLTLGVLMTSGVPATWEGLGVLAALLVPVMIHFHATFPEQRWPAERRWPMAVLYGGGLAVALHWIPSLLPYSSWEVAWPLTTLWLGLGFAAAIGLMVAAYVTTTSAYARRRIRVVVLGTVLGFGPFGLLTVLSGWVSGMLTIPLMIAVPVAYAVALWQHNLMGFDRVLQRGLVYLVVGAALFGVYFAVLTFFNLLLPADTVGRAALGAAAALVAALTLQPLRNWIQRLIDRLFYGGWYDYRGLVEEVGHTLARTLDRETLAKVLVRQVPEVMHLRGAALLLERNGRMEVVSARGMTVTEKHWMANGRVEMAAHRALVPLVVESQTVGLWILGGRPAEEWGPEDERILTVLGRQAALAAQSVRLIAQLREKVAEVEEVHRRLLVAREEERAELARELHDGVIQDLVGLRYRLEELPGRANEADQMEEMHAQVGLLIDELRRLCGDLRPPMLDQLGLAAALRALARKVTARGLPVEVHLEAVSLSEGMAIGLYRICQEALSNALRHAAASSAVILLSRDGDEVSLTVADDGGGFDPSGARGQAGCFGLMGMTERAEALGGRLKVDSAPGEGTRVTVRCRNRD